MVAQIAAMWHRYPDWRLGQLLVNVVSANSGDLFYVEDAVLAAWTETK